MGHLRASHKNTSDGVVPKTPLTEETILARKNAEKYAISTLIFEKFSGAIAPRPPCWGGATAPLPRPYSPRLSAPRSGPSVPHQCPKKYFLGPIWPTQKFWRGAPYEGFRCACARNSFILFSTRPPWGSVEQRLCARNSSPL